MRVASFAKPQSRLDHVVDRRAQPERLGHRRRENARSLAPVAGLMCPAEVDRFVVGTVRVAGVRDADRRDVHRRAAVDDVPDAGVARVGVPVAKLEHEPLLRQEEAVIEQVLAAELGHPHRLVDDLREHQRLDVVGVEVVALDVVGMDENARHQRVVGDVAVALVERRERLLDLERPANRLDDPGHPAVEVRVDLVRLPALRRTAERVTDRGSGEAADGPVGQQVSVHVLILVSQSLCPSRPSGSGRPAGNSLSYPLTLVQPSLSDFSSSWRVVEPRRYWTKAG